MLTICIATYLLKMPLYFQETSTEYSGMIFGTIQSCLGSLAMALLLKLQPSQVLPFSTGVIMEPLQVDRIVAGLPKALADANETHWAQAAEGIMTTDTLPKAFSKHVDIAGVPVTVTGISKGAGMIRPNMATMLGCMATDANIAPALYL